MTIFTIDILDLKVRRANIVRYKIEEIRSLQDDYEQKTVFVKSVEKQLDDIIFVISKSKGPEMSASR